MTTLTPRQLTLTGTHLQRSPVSVSCGFPSPAQDYYDGPVDLSEMLIEDEAATFVVRASGHSMTGAGISDGDELLVDRALRPRDGDVVVAVLDGELTVKRLEVGRGGVTLRAESADHPDVLVAELSELQIWGVVTYSLHRLRALRTSGGVRVAGR